MELGVNLNNREPLIAPAYSLADLLSLAAHVEELGFESVWVGDSLFSKPRFDPICLLSAISQRTSRVRLGTACLVTSTRNPLYLAMQWATLDHLAAGRSILGACMGNPEQGVRREFEALGLDYAQRAAIFTEGLAVLRSLWTEGSVTFAGQHFRYDNLSFHSGTEMEPLGPIQRPPPIWVVSNIRLMGALEPAVAKERLRTACRRVVEYGDGWMSCCRAQHPDEVAEQVDQLRIAAGQAGKDFSRLVMSYQVTMNIGDSDEAARAAFNEYISNYYPELSQAVDLSNWGPVGTPETIIEWFRAFHAAGVQHFICRFGALDQFGQVDRFARDVLPALRSTVGSTAAT